MRKYLLRFAMSTLAMTLAAVGATVMPGAAHAVPGEPDPVINRAVFNDPFGTTAEQHALFIQLARLIDRVPAGETLQLSWFGFDYYDVDDTADRPDLVDRLVAAHQRGVKVQIILDHAAIKHTPYARLLPVLGGNDAANSYIVHCGEKRGCIATRILRYSDGVPHYAYNHNKLLIASKVVLNDGTEVSGVVYQASGNLGRWDAVESYNNGVTWSDAASYAAYSKYFRDLRDYRKTAGNNNYYTVMPSGTTYKAHFFPRHERAGQPLLDPATDTVISILNSVKSCSYQERMPDGSLASRQTDIRVAMLAINRPEIVKKLAALRAAGCWVDVVYTGIPDDLRAMFGSKVQLTKCDVPHGTDPETGDTLGVKVHHKYMLIDGAYDDDIVPRVFTGSHNYGIGPLRNADETLVRIMGRGMHDDYVRNFWRVRDKCRAAPGGKVQ